MPSCKFCSAEVTEKDFWVFVDGGSYVCEKCVLNNWAKHENEFSKEWD